MGVNDNPARMKRRDAMRSSLGKRHGGLPTLVEPSVRLVPRRHFFDIS